MILAAWAVRRWRAWLGDLWLWGLALFLLTIGPLLGMFHFTWQQFAFHSDHYMYIPGVGLFLALALLVERWRTAAPSPKEGSRPAEPDAATGARRRSRSLAVAVLAVPVFVALGWKTVVQSRTWKNNKTLWSQTIAVNPGCQIAQFNLGNFYVRKGKCELAIPHYLAADEILPILTSPITEAARCAKTLGRTDDAAAYYRKAIAMRDRRERGSYSHRRELATYLRSTGRPEEALAEYETLLKLYPRRASHAAQSVRELEEQLGLDEKLRR